MDQRGFYRVEDTAELRLRVAADLEHARFRGAVRRRDLDADRRGLDGIEGVPREALKVALDLGDGAAVYQDAVVAHGLGLRRADQVYVLRLLGAERELSAEAAVEGDLDFADAAGPVPAQFDP